MTDFLAKSPVASSSAFFPDASNESLADRSSSDFFDPPAPPRSTVAEPATRIVIGMPSPTLVCGLRSLLLLTGIATLTGSSTSIEAFLASCSRDGAVVALVDPALGNMPICAFMKSIRLAAPKLRVILMTDLHQPHVVREAMRTGASAIIERTADAREIHAALSAVAGGSRYIAPAIAVQLAEALTLMDLTNRETEVLALLSRGECNKNIARGLGVTVGTAKTHVRAIMNKLGARSRTEAVHKAYRLGMVCLDH
jgi:DNA-binding NarL/FixJ family response regulator